jgi:hypothetical protein
MRPIFDSFIVPTSFLINTLVILKRSNNIRYWIRSIESPKLTHDLNISKPDQKKDSRLRLQILHKGMAAINENFRAKNLEKITI